ncbi:MAG: transglutaminase family protein [Polyangiaceae bacterium]|nr:transglutaminase family protein [Polyangiaceae bacterium]
MSFANDTEKFNFLAAVGESFGRHPELVDLAHRLAGHLRPDDYVGRATQIHRFVRDGIKYQRDPGQVEQLADPISVLQRGYDDCDGKVVLAVALMRALGLEAEPHGLWQGDVLKHVQYRVRWPGSGDAPFELRAPGGWVRGEVTIRGAELGQDPYSVPRDPETGRLPLA